MRSIILKAQIYLLNTRASATKLQRKSSCHSPPGTHGFLYYLSPNGDMTDGQIRFRITQDCNPVSFVGGRDLVFSTGLSWHIPLRLLRGSTKSGILCLLSEDLVAKGTLLEETTPPTKGDANLHMQLPRRRTLNPLITEFGQLFSIDFSLRIYTLWIKIGQHFEGVRFPNPLTSYENSRRSNSYDGVALCCFEPSPRSNRRKRDTAVLRLVKIIKPFTRKEHVKRSSTEAVEPPEEGQLFMSEGREREYFLRGSLSEASGTATRS
ncbi:hypothetical protein EW146_g3602 [Bondarzewia mesenterica]|uniref:Uncharacterized protein n=1 Tax=Bondarzewia mesenterica TaxID=1095465 RepID=A0A4S4LZB0_9AGAM|nr:hypothetical protein EW146_g3602 [Bondarzewia mesenterica]